ncbi:Immunoglobulin domain containing protein [Aphelenchoides besseyi]|nr:Immunoglobulin domain containing protein [Aphelenchoides besseyi]KAI6207705.1 Immunoglobulin domain containing protein [Aphelenchoides besseyi]
MTTSWWLDIRLLNVLLLFLSVQTAQSALLARGPRAVILNVDSAKGGGGTASATGKLALWCQAVDKQSGRSVPIKRATFRFGSLPRVDAQISSDSYNATLIRDNSPAIETGTWRCDLHTDYGNATGNIVVYSRPVIYSNTSLRIDEKDGSSTTFHVTGLTAVRGSKVVLTCPVTGYPKPEIVWRHDGRQQIQGSGETLTIEEVTEENEGLFVCTASNRFAISGQWQVYELVVERQLRIKSEYAWIIPLLVILIIAVVLVVTIFACEYRKKRNEQKPIMDED